MAFQEVAVEIAALKGTTDAYFEGIKEAANVQNIMAKAFQEGRASVIDFADSLYAAGMASAGTLTQLDAFASTLGYDLPNNFKLTEESAKGLVSAFSGIPGVMRQLASESVAAGKGMLDGVVGAIQDGGKEVNEELDKLEEELGTNFPESVKDALENSALSTAMADNMEKMIDNAQVALVNGADKLDVKGMVDKKALEWMDAWEENGIEMNKSTATIFDAIREHISKGPAEGPNGMRDYLEQLDALIKAADASTDPLASSIQKLANIDFSAAVNQMQAYSSVLKNIVADFKDVGSGAQNLQAFTDKANQAGITDFVASTDKEGNVISSSAALSEGPKPGAGGGAADVTASVTKAQQALDNLMSSASAIFTAIQTLGATTFSTIATQAATAAAGITTSFGTMSTGMMSIFTALVTGAVGSFTNIGAASAISLQTVAANFQGMLTIGMTVLTGLVTAAVGSFTNIGTASAITVQTVAANFQGMLTIAMTTLTAIVEFAIASFTNVGTASAIAVQTIAANMLGVQNVFQASMTAMVGAAASAFGTIATVAGTVAAEINRTFNTMANAIVGYLSAMATRSATSFTQISNAAKSTAMP